MSERLQLLVADDNSTDRMILEAILRRLGHDVLAADNGEQAIQLFIDKHPDMVLLDVMMPGLDGIATARRLRELAGEELVPIIFVTSLHAVSDLTACLDAGGDDFISKPYNPTILKAKLNAFTRTRLLHKEVQAQREFLIQEQRMAKAIFDNIAHHGVLNAPNIRYRISPMSIFNGDVLVAARQPSGDLLVLLGDFTGHGLPAAIGTLPLSEIFHGMAGKGFSLEYILREINTKLKNVLPTGVFCCATAACLSYRGRSIEVWAGGLPDGVIFNRRSRELRQIASSHLPLGILSDRDFKYEPTLFEMSEGDLVYLWSDGIVETANAKGEQFGLERVLALFNASADGAGVFDGVLAAVQDFSADGRQQDDHTLIEIALAPGAEGFEHPASARRKLAPSALGPQRWQLHYELKADSLRQFDPVPMLTHVFLQVPGLRQHGGKVNTILSELFSNALEHGVLGLSSALKADAHGFHQYYQLRAERLQALQEGYVNVTAEHEPKAGGGGVLTLTVQDSGQGFDCAALPGDQGNPKFYGRGMILVSSLCQRVQYLEPGNQVTVEFAWDDA